MKRLFFILLIMVIGLTSFTFAKDVNQFDFTLNAGWNLVSTEVIFNLNENLLEKHTSFYYDPIIKDYVLFEDGFNNNVNEYMNNYLIKDDIASFWIYNDGQAENYQINMLNSGFNRAELEFVKLKKGWNFLSITKNMYFEDDGTPNKLSPEKIKGTCTIEKAYIYNSLDSNWLSWGLETNNFDDDTIGMGWVVKVTDDCKLGFDSNIAPPPTIPNN